MRKSIYQIEIGDIAARWDAEENDFITRIFIRKNGPQFSFEAVFPGEDIMVGLIQLQQKEAPVTPDLEISNKKGNIDIVEDGPWSIWRFTGEEMDIDFPHGIRVTFKIVK